MSEYVDFLIVGGGIAGLSLQYELEQRSQKTLVIDRPDRNVSTRIAAGIVNPIAGKFFALSWRADDFFPGLEQHYCALESKLKTSFFYPKPIYRILPTAGEQNTWLSKSHLPKYEGYCSYIADGFPGAKGDFGALQINYGGFLDTSAYLDALWKYSSERNAARKACFDFSELDLTARTYEDITFGQIVFCEGKDVVDNPLFKSLPFSPNKGEGLVIATKSLDPKLILVGGVFVLPVANGLFKVGASYDHHDLSLEPTDNAKQYLIDRFERMLDVDYEVVDRFVGLRPAVKDRRPILGKHAQYPFVCIYNGLGSKGVSMSPVLSKEMAEHLLEGVPLHKECDIKRFDNNE